MQRLDPGPIFWQVQIWNDRSRKPKKVTAGTQYYQFSFFWKLSQLSHNFQKCLGNSHKRRSPYWVWAAFLSKKRFTSQKTRKPPWSCRGLSLEWPYFEIHCVFFSADFSAVSAVTHSALLYFEMDSLVGFVVLELLILKFFAARQKTSTVTIK